MTGGARRWLIGLGTAAAMGASVLAQAPTASAAPASTAAGAAPASTAAGAAGAPASQVLRFGMRGPAVKALQQRLQFLHYYAGKVDGQFGWDTLEGVWAFKEVQSGKIEPRNASIVGATMQRQLLHPTLPRVLHPNGGRYLRIEINKKIEVLVLYNHSKIQLITHVSTGGGYYYCSGGSCSYAVTPDGRYKALSFLQGNVTVPLGAMYNPVFFIGRAYAIHGEPNGGVPLYPASHGCVRIPWDLASYFHKLIKIVSIDGRGTPIWISG
ncbi:MAG TPA: L,D-transpeptidase family protein [Streptosporangiaceae bacterium]|nr:L,D-transpeptidase family protein [Streptosporangiaceae bacterium]